MSEDPFIVPPDTPEAEEADEEEEEEEAAAEEDEGVDEEGGAADEEAAVNGAAVATGDDAADAADSAPGPEEELLAASGVADEAESVPPDAAEPLEGRGHAPALNGTATAPELAAVLDVAPNPTPGALPAATNAPETARTSQPLPLDMFSDLPGQSVPPAMTPEVGTASELRASATAPVADLTMGVSSGAMAPAMASAAPVGVAVPLDAVSITGQAGSFASASASALPSVPSTADTPAGMTQQPAVAMGKAVPSVSEIDGTAMPAPVMPAASHDLPALGAPPQQPFADGSAIAVASVPVPSQLYQGLSSAGEAPVAGMSPRPPAPFLLACMHLVQLPAWEAVSLLSWSGRCSGPVAPLLLLSHALELAGPSAMDAAGALSGNPFATPPQPDAAAQ
jgi:hypothetical protein